MEGFSFGDVVSAMQSFILAANERAANLDGRAAFVLGLLTWFAVEQAIRRLSSLLRIAIIVAALGAIGVASLIAPPPPRRATARSACPSRPCRRSGS